MLTDIVVDTNVLVHASSQGEVRRPDCVRLIKAILASTTKLCVDREFAFGAANNPSYISLEYTQHLRSGTVGYNFVLAMAQWGRLQRVPKKARDLGAAKQVDQLIRKPKDRVFLGVAYNSSSRVLISHDYEDFQINKRACIKKELKVEIIEADKGADLFDLENSPNNEEQEVATSSASVPTLGETALPTSR